MATTSPDNLYSPDSSDPYALTQDLGAMQDSVQSALVRRANAYVGTSAQRNAFTSAPVGTIWSDTNGSRLVYKRGASSWEPVSPPVVEAKGQVSVSVVSSNSGSVTVSLPTGRFSAPPLVFLSKQSGGGAKFIPYASSITASSFNVGVYSGDGTSATQTVVVGWLAVPAS